MEATNATNKFYEAQIYEHYEHETKSGEIKFRKNKFKYVVYCESLNKAEELINNAAKSIFDDFEIVSLKKSNVIGVINGTQTIGDLQ